VSCQRYSCAMETVRRPIGIWVIVILESLNVAFAILDIVLGSRMSGGDLERLTQADPVARLLVFGWAGCVAVAAISLFMLRRRGWALMMLLVGIALLFHLATWWNDPAKTPWISMGVNVVTAFYLNSAGVRQLFLRHHEVTRISIGGRDSQ